VLGGVIDDIPARQLCRWQPETGRIIGKEKKTLPRGGSGKDASTPAIQYAFRYPCFRAEVDDITRSYRKPA
jgi:hypothetical protein